MRHDTSLDPELLAPLVAAPGRSALVLDVDGTLAPIAPRPELARVPAETRAELRGDQGARMVLERNNYRLVRVPMSNAAIDLDTPEDLAALNERFQRAVRRFFDQRRKAS